MDALYQEISKNMYFSNEMDENIYQLSMIIQDRNKNSLVCPILINGLIGTGKTELLKIINRYYNSSSIFITIEKGNAGQYYLERIKNIITKENSNNVIDIVLLDNIHLINNYKNYIIKLNKYIKDNINRDILLICTSDKAVSSNYSAYFYLVNIKEYSIIEKINIVEKLKYKIMNKIGHTFDITPQANIELNLFHRMSLGISNLERDLTLIVQKKVINNENNYKLTVEKCDVEKYFLNEEKSLYSVSSDFKIGITNSLTYNTDVNFQLKVEAKVVEKSFFKTYIFGNLDKEAVDSIRIASYCAIDLLHQKAVQISEQKTLAVNLYGIETLKQGSSCGLAIFVACVSSILSIPVSQNIGFTGEITLYGNIVGVGNIEDKIIQGYNRGIIEFYLPLQNKTEVNMLPSSIKEKIKICLVDRIEQVYNIFFIN